MASIKTALSALTGLDSKVLVKSVDKLSRDQLEELATKANVVEAVVHMSGSWIEETYVELTDSKNKVIQKKVPCEQEYRGKLLQFFHLDTLHDAALFVLHQCIDEEFDEDYFEPGSMLLDIDGADDVELNFECTGESIDTDVEEYEVNYGKYSVELSSVAITANTISLYIDSGKTLELPLKDASIQLKWFIFSLLFKSSRKTYDDFKNGSEAVDEFIEQNFEG